MGTPRDAPPLSTTAPLPAGGHEARRRSRERTMRSVSRGTGVMMVATFVLVILQFLTRVLVTRTVSAEQWGEFNLGLALANFLALIAAFGIPTATARSMAFEETVEQRLHLVRTAVLVSVPVGFASSILVYLGAADLASLFQNASGLTPVFQLFSVSIALTMLSNVLVGIFQGLERAEPNALFVQILNPALFFTFTAVLLFAGWHFTGVLVGYVLSWVVAFAALAIYSYRRLPILIRRLSSTVFSGDASARVGFFALSVTLFGVATLSYLTSYADTLLLGVFRDNTTVGQYSSAMTLTRLLLVGTGTITFVYLPITSRLRRERDFQGLKETYITVTRWMALLTLPLTFIFLFDPVFSLGFVFSPSQEAGADALRILVVANTASILLGPSTSTLGGLGKTRSVLGLTVISTAANFGLCFALIPPFGMVGAAIAWSAARLLFPGLALLQIYLEHGITPFQRRFTRPLLLSFVVLVPVFWFLPTHYPLLFIIAALGLPLAAYALAILLTRSVDHGDLFVARALERRFGGIARPLRRILEARLDPSAPEESMAPVTGPIS